MFDTTTLLTLTVISSALLLGGLLALLFGHLTEVVREQFGLSQRGETGLSVTFVVALMAFLFLGGVSADYWGLKVTLVLGSSLAAFSVASLAVSKGVPGAFFFMALLGAATGLLHVATTVAMPLALFGLDLAANPRDLGQVPAATNLGYMFVALGGLLIPFLIGFLVSRFSFRNGLLALALLAVVPAVAATFTTGIDVAPAQALDLAALFRETNFWLALVAIFCFYGVETSLLRWAPKYLSDVGLSQQATLVLSIVFWLIFLAARLLCAAISSTTAFVWILLILVLSATTLIGNMMGMYRSRSGAKSFLILAVSLGPVFPILAGLTLIFFHSQAAVAFGALSAAGTLGRLLAAPVTDSLVAAGKVRSAMAVSTVLCLVAFFPPLIWLVFL